jgi:2-C-methyl-D-erythritol 4-phosphate cytidylyltransferase
MAFCFLTRYNDGIGHAVRLVECGTQNIKVTTIDDLIIAEAILKQRELEASLEDV